MGVYQYNCIYLLWLSNDGLLFNLVPLPSTLPPPRVVNYITVMMFHINQPSPQSIGGGLLQSFGDCLSIRPSVTTLLC